MNSRLVIKLVIRIGLIIVFTLLSQHFFKIEKWITASFFIILIVVSLIELYLFFSRANLEGHKLILAMRFDDYSQKTTSNNNDPNFLKDIKTLYEKTKNQHLSQMSLQIIYENILNNMHSGLMILRKKELGRWEIYLLNDTMSELLKIPKYRYWSHLSERMPEFTSLFEKEQFQSFSKAINLSLEGKESQVYSLKTSHIKTFDFQYYIMSMDSVQNIVEKKEKQAWYDLMKVISHELMNTLTPISALVDHLGYYLTLEQWDETDKTDFNISLKTIQKKAVHIMEFVENYRVLTEVPSPVKRKIPLRDLLEESIQLMATILKEKNVNIDIHPETESILIDVDMKLMERVYVNLITNSLYAGATHITLNAKRKNNRIQLTIVDNGVGIDASIASKIFIPFFTTRENGGGIGLPLSKSIVEAHGGYLTYQSDGKETIFTISLIVN